jgi:hypothetical protein
MGSITVTLKLSGQLLQQLQRYINHMDKVDATMAEEDRIGPLDMDVAILTLMKNGLDSFNDSRVKTVKPDKGGSTNA